MKSDMEDGLTRVVILNVSGVYAQIYDQGYFNKGNVTELENIYGNKKLWRVLELND